MPNFSQTISFSDAMRPFNESIQLFYSSCFCIILLISGYVFWIIYSLLFSNTITLYPRFHEGDVECSWRIFPCLILLGLALPSLSLLYSMESFHRPFLTCKVTGHQWYWSYSYSTLQGDETSYDSYMVQDDDMLIGDIRCLEVDNRLVLPTGVLSRVLVSSDDVLHSWAVPSLGVKADAIPGRLNSVNIIPLTPGIFYGQCSEICGANHRFIPICIESISPFDFIKFLEIYTCRLCKPSAFQAGILLL